MKTRTLVKDVNLRRQSIAHRIQDYKDNNIRTKKQTPHLK